MLNGVKAVVVDDDLQKIEPLAYHFVCDFAKDNDLQVSKPASCPSRATPSPDLSNYLLASYA
jgi:hypothetical protein